MNKQTRKVMKVQQPGKQQANYMSVPQTNSFNSTQKIRFNQSSKKHSVERVGIHENSKLNILPVPGSYVSTQSTHAIPSGMISATAPAQLVLNDRSQSSNLLNNTQNVPLGRSAIQSEIESMQFNNT